MLLSWRPGSDACATFPHNRTCLPLLCRRYACFAACSRFVDPQPFALEPSFADTSNATPLIFVLSPGSDPMAALLKFAEERGVRVESVSLGQGQAPVAQKLIEEGSTAGYWVVLQVCRQSVRSILGAPS
jgi:hypothetical protein